MILGLNAFNRDASAALVIDGRVVAAVEEERLSRVRHAGGFPGAAIRACLEIAGLGIDSVEHLAFARRPERNMGGPILYALAGRSSYTPELRTALEEAAQPVDWFERVARAVDVSPDRLRFKVHAVEHQLAHAAAAYYASPFEEAAILTVDTVGDFCSTLLARGRGTEIEVLERVLFPHSLGLFFAMISQLIGFEAVGDESRTMGLSALGSDRFVREMRRLVRPARQAAFELDLDFFRHATDGEAVRPVESAPRRTPLYSALAVEQFGPPRHPDEPLGDRERDLAFACQRVLEERLLDVASRLRRAARCEDLVYGGQVAMNAVANRLLRLAGPFRWLAVGPSPGDSGLAIGAALHAAAGLGVAREDLTFADERVNLGPSFDRDRARNALEDRGLSYEEPENPVASIVAALDAGEVVGWFDGRMELGPRALGHRSILADPRRAASSDRLRRALSREESSRSFGASVLLEHASRFFEDATTSPYMLESFRVRPTEIGRIPAVVHADGTTRLHTVVREANPLYYDLLSAFGEKTDVPVLLNTSLNLDEPLACTPEQAVGCALRAGLDRLMISGLVARLPRGREIEGARA